MRLKFLNSTTFRIALFYGIFFCVTVSGLLAFVYFATVREMEDQIKHRITAQMNAAVHVYNTRGIEALKSQLAEYIDEEVEGLAINLLEDDNNDPIAGNLETWPEEVTHSGEWILFDIEANRELGLEYVNILAQEYVLSNKYRMLMGYSLRGPNRAKEIVLSVVKLSVLLSLFFTLLGSALLSSAIRRKLGKVNTICKQVISGNLEVSVPQTHSADEFDKLTDNVNSMLQRIAELVKGLQQTSDNIAHDLRTPLNRHRIRLEKLLTHPKQHALEEQIRHSMEEIDSIVDTLNSLLRISQAQSGVTSGHFTVFNLSDSIGDVIDFYAAFAEEKAIILHQNIPASLNVNADKPMLTQSIANLLDNAIKYTPDQGVVSITLTSAGNTVVCSIADNGTGVPTEFREKIKERFFRMEASRTSKGTGLGLSLVEAVAKLHRGTLMLEDNNPGLKATLTLPIVA